jgi:hypothetical protein
VAVNRMVKYLMMFCVIFFMIPSFLVLFRGIVCVFGMVMPGLPRLLGWHFPSLGSTQNVCLSRIFFISLRFKVQDSDDLML